ncbi:MAG: SDR family NAD(P)-dependent oxidoreductase [Bacteroidales bacterium]|jgi:uncharacterized protein YbjT (DUF2867 family)|nr:SDR family NAD(P)-dependent oxidoreductase [Bacteroidales bacterium]
MYIITAATGNIGKALATGLLAKGKKVRVIGRSADKLKELAEKGAEPFVGDVKDAAFIKDAFKYGTAVFCLIPPNPLSADFRAEQDLIARNYRDAVKSNHIRYAVLLSSIGAHLRNGAGVVDGLGAMEEFFKGLKEVNVLNLRPSYFLENLYGQIGTIKAMGIMGSSVKGDISLPIVATRDIAAIATKRLLELAFRGNTIEYVLGSRDISYDEIASIVGKAIGKPDLRYVQFSYEDAKNAMVQSGFVSENVAELFNGLSKGMNNGTALNAHHRTAENTTLTSIEEFAQWFANAYSQA